MEQPIDGCGRKWRVGYWLSQKKMKKICFDQFLAKCRAENLEMFELDFDKLNEQLPMDAVVHKLSDFIVLSEQGDSLAKEIVRKTEELEKSHPEILMFDPMSAVRILCNRIDQYSLLDFICSRKVLSATPVFRSRFAAAIKPSANNNALKAKSVRWNDPVASDVSSFDGFCRTLPMPKSILKKTTSYKCVPNLNSLLSDRSSTKNLLSTTKDSNRTERGPFLKNYLNSNNVNDGGCPVKKEEVVKLRRTLSVYECDRILADLRSAMLGNKFR